MKKIIHYLTHPIYSIRKIFYLLFANSIGRLAYPPKVFRSIHFKGMAAPGWQWVTQCFWTQRVLGINSNIPWPCSSRIMITNPNNIDFDMDDLNNFQTFGNYYQSFGEIHIGKGTFIAPNVGIITENHNIEDPALRMSPKSVLIGEKCWIGMNSMILPGVKLGNHTVVGAGSVVTKSFEEGYCVILGNPAKIVRQLNYRDIELLKD